MNAECFNCGEPARLTGDNEWTEEVPLCGKTDCRQFAWEKMWQADEDEGNIPFWSDDESLTVIVAYALWTASVIPRCHSDQERTRRLNLLRTLADDIKGVIRFERQQINYQRSFDPAKLSTPERRERHRKETGSLNDVLIDLRLLEKRVDDALVKAEQAKPDDCW